MEDLSAAPPETDVPVLPPYYAPNNATLVVAGDIDLAAAREDRHPLVQGHPAAGPPVARPQVPPAKLAAEKRTVPKYDVRLPKLVLAWPTVSADHPADAALGARMRRPSWRPERPRASIAPWCTEKRMAQSVRGCRDARAYGGQFQIEVLARPGHDLREILAAVDGELARARETAPAATEVQRVVNRRETSFLDGLQQVGGFGGKADLLNDYWFYAANPDYVAEDLARFRSLEASDLQVAARRWLTPERVVVSIVPKDGPPWLSQLVTEVPDELASGDALPGRDVPPALGPVPAFRLPEPERAALSNGIPVLLVRVGDVPIADVRLVVRAGATSDPRERPGLAEWTTAMLLEGAGGKDPLAFAEALDQLGARLSTDTGWDASALVLHAPLSRLTPALALMADAALRPDFRPEDWKRLAERRATAFLQARDEPSSLSEFAVARAVWGPEHRYGLPVEGSPAWLPVPRWSRSASSTAPAGGPTAPSSSWRARWTARRYCRSSSGRSAPGRARGRLRPIPTWRHLRRADPHARASTWSWSIGREPRSRCSRGWARQRRRCGRSTRPTP